MLIADFLNSFSVIDAKRDHQIQIHKKAMGELLPDKSQIEFVLRKSSHMNLRMRNLDKLRLPILIPEKNNPGLWYDTAEYSFLPFQEYEKILRTESWDRSFISEICEPLRYRDALTFGYIRVHSLNTLDLKSYQIVHHIARKFEDFVARQPSLPLLSLASVKVQDISHSGLAFLHPLDKELYQKLQNGESILLDLSFPGKDPLTYIAKIRSGFQQGDCLRFGLEFMDNSSTQQSAIDSFIDETAQD